MSIISKFLGIFFKFIYDTLSTVMPEPKSISYFALTIIISTIILKLAILPVSISQIKSQKKMAELQPELQKIQKKYKSDPKTLAAKQQQLYKDSNYSMLSGCLPMIVQLIILIAFYRVFYQPAVYAFPEPGFYDSIAKNFFYIQNIDHPDKTMIIPIIAAISTFLTSWVTTKNPATKSNQNDQSQQMMKSMMYIMPLFILWMGKKFAVALVLYWIVSNLFMFVQQLIQNRMIENEMEAE